MTALTEQELKQFQDDGYLVVEDLFDPKVVLDPLIDEYEGVMDASARHILDVLHEVAASHQRTVAQTAINWVLSHPEVSAAITGGDTPEHMDDNVGAIGWSITEQERERLDHASAGQRRVLQ